MSRIRNLCVVRCSLSHACSRRQFLGTLAVAGVAARIVRSAGAGDESPTPRFLLQWGKRGMADGEFSANIGVAIGKNDEVYTSEFRNQRVQKFTADGKFLSSFALPTNPGGLAVDPDGNVYVAFWNANKVAAFAPNGVLLHEWGQKGTADGEFQLPGSIAYGPDGLLYVPDQGNSRVQKFTTDGKFVGAFGGHGSEPGQFGGSVAAGGRFAGPQFVAFDSAGNIYTTDAGLDRVQKFSPEGAVLAYWGSDSAEPGGFGPAPLSKEGTPIQGGPISICIDQQDRVWVSATNNRVQQFSNSGEYICGIAGEGTEPGQFHLPHGLAIDSRNCLYIADTMNARIQKFAIDA